MTQYIHLVVKSVAVSVISAPNEMSFYEFPFMICFIQVLENSVSVQSVNIYLNNPLQ